MDSSEERGKREEREQSGTACSTPSESEPWPFFAFRGFYHRASCESKRCEPAVEHGQVCSACSEPPVPGIVENYRLLLPGLPHGPWQGQGTHRWHGPLGTDRSHRILTLAASSSWQSAGRGSTASTTREKSWWEGRSASRRCAGPPFPAHGWQCLGEQESSSRRECRHRRPQPAAGLGKRLPPRPGRANGLRPTPHRQPGPILLGHTEHRSPTLKGMPPHQPTIAHVLTRTRESASSRALLPGINISLQRALHLTSSNFSPAEHPLKSSSAEDKAHWCSILVEVPLPLDAASSILTNSSRMSPGNPHNSLAFNTQQEELVPIPPIQNNLPMFENKQQKYVPAGVTSSMLSCL
ncbi:uncharacterized protein LOC134551872 [Prinia subflava]|uniref:uncharacterized protein LOC134551872 n=1 Tax=Prinia subflava TaxID=208062 RepID=UPI002FE0226F